MAARETQVLIVVVTVGILALQLLTAAGFFLFIARAPAAPAPAVVTGATTGAAPLEYTASVVAAEQNPDHSWTLDIRLTKTGTRTWDTIQVTGQVVGPAKAYGPWPATPAGTPPAGVPAQLDLRFTTPPIPQPRASLRFRIEVDLSHSGLTGSGSCSYSSHLDFPPAAPK